MLVWNTPLVPKSCSSYREREREGERKETTREVKNCRSESWLPHRVLVLVEETLGGVVLEQSTQFSPLKKKWKIK